MSFKERMTQDGGEVFPPTADGIRRWFEGTRPAPARRDALDYIQGLRADGTLPEDEVAKLAVTFPELAGHESPSAA